MPTPLRPLVLNYPPTSLELFAVDDDGAVKVASKSDNGAWNPPVAVSPAGAAQPGAPLAGAFHPPGGALEVFYVARGSAHVLWKAPHVGDAWQGPHPIGGDLPAPDGAHAVAVHYPHGGTMEVFVVGDDGGVHGLWKAPHVGDTWQRPFRLADAGNLAPPGGHVAAVHYPPGETLEVFVACHDGRIRGLWKAPHVQHAWQAPFVLVDADVTTPGASLAVVHYPPDEKLELFFVDHSGVLTVLWKHANEAWQGALHLSHEGFAPAGAPVTACYYPAAKQLEVHVVGTDGRVWVAWKGDDVPWKAPHPLTEANILRPGTPITSTSYPVNDQLEAFVGDETWFARVLWKHHNGMWAPCATPLGPRSGATFAPAAQTRRVAQLTGTDDFIRARVRGVDLGANTSHRGRHFVFFGDVPRLPGDDGPPHDADAVVRVAAFSPNISLEVIRSGEHFAPFTIQKRDGTTVVPRTDQTPTGAFSDDAFAYVFFLVHDQPGAGWPDPVIYLTRHADPSAGEPYEEVFRWADPKVLQVAPKVVDNASVPGLPSTSGRGVVMLGGGKIDGDFNAGDAVHLAWMPLRRGVKPRVEEIHYHRGDAGWSAPGDHASATPLWHLPGGYTSLSLTFVGGANRWLALYSRATAFGHTNRPQGAVVARSAPTPAGPWSDEIPVFDPCREGAFGAYMHWPNLDDLDEHDPSKLTGGTGHAYGAFVLEPLTQWNREDGTVTLHYLMSTFRPYQVHHMTSRFRLT
ncbi:MAG TPA: hypothetical protein VF230_03530 [Acidimicrobiales bacterium]